MAPLSFSVSPLARLRLLTEIDVNASPSTSVNAKSDALNVFDVSSVVLTLLD